MRGGLKTLMCAGLSEVGRKWPRSFGLWRLMQFWRRGRIFGSEARRAYLKSNRCGSEVGRDDGEMRAWTNEGTMSTSLRSFLAGIGGHENMPTRGALKVGGALHGCRSRHSGPGGAR